MERRAISAMNRAVLVLSLILVVGYFILNPFLTSVLQPVFGPLMGQYASAAVLFVLFVVLIWFSWKYVHQARP